MVTLEEEARISDLKSNRFYSLFVDGEELPRKIFRPLGSRRLLAYKVDENLFYAILAEGISFSLEEGAVHLSHSQFANGLLLSNEEPDENRNALYRQISRNFYSSHI